MFFGIVRQIAEPLLQAVLFARAFMIQQHRAWVTLISPLIYLRSQTDFHWVDRHVHLGDSFFEFLIILLFKFLIILLLSKVIYGF